MSITRTMSTATPKFQFEAAQLHNESSYDTDTLLAAASLVADSLQIDPAGIIIGVQPRVPESMAHGSAIAPRKEFFIDLAIAPAENFPWVRKTATFATGIELFVFIFAHELIHVDEFRNKRKQDEENCNWLALQALYEYRRSKR
jgi:hypothetical protein